MKTIEEVMKQKRTDGTDIRQQAGSYASLSSPMEAQNCDDKVAAAKRTWGTTTKVSNIFLILSGPSDSLVKLK